MLISGISEYSDNDEIKSYYRSIQETSTTQSVEADSNAKKSKDEENSNDPAYNVSISNTAMMLYNSEKDSSSTQKAEDTQPEISYGHSTETESTELPKTTKSDSTENNTSDNKDSGELTDAEKEEVRELKARDQEVRTHEAAHRAAAGGLSTTAPSYTYQTGPDGNRYAIGGEVNITFSESDDPEENIKNAQAMKASALAPAEPSAQDRSVAARADKIIADARQKLAQKNAKNAYGAEDASNSSQSIYGDNEETDDIDNEFSNIPSNSSKNEEKSQVA